MRIRKLNKKSKRELSIGALFLVIATAGYLLGWTNLFTVKEISVYGSPNTQITNQILQIAGVAKGEKLARVEPRSINSKMQSAGFDWVKEVEVSRNWFSRTVNIKLTTRSAVARLDGTDEYLDNEGARFKIPKELIPSKGVQELVLISAANPNNQRAAVDFYRSLPSDFKSELKGIAASSSSNFEVSVNNIKKDIGVLRINWGSATDNALKVKIYRALIALPENSKITTMDLSDPNSPTVK